MIARVREKAGVRALDLAHCFRHAYKLWRSARGCPSPSALARTLCRFLAASSIAPPPMRPHQATMPPRRCGSLGYRSVRERPSGVYYAEIRSGDVRIGLGTLQTSHEVARAYDAAAWRLARPRAQMNFYDVYTCEQAQALAPPSRLITHQDQLRTLHFSASAEAIAGHRVKTDERDVLN
ncbi:AP2-containing protein [Hordeum vulgare]|nr:AP2-containing protein [Hordeum vulgare]